MQTNANQCKNDLFEEIEFEEIGEKSSKFGEFYESGYTPSRVVEWKIPEFGKTLRENSAKFRIYPFAIKTGRAIGYVLVFVLSVFGQALWFVLLVTVSVLAAILQSLFGQSHVHKYGQRHRDKKRQYIDWRDIPTGWDAKGQAYVRKKLKERDRQRQRQVNNVNVNVNVNIENN